MGVTVSGREHDGSGGEGMFPIQCERFTTEVLSCTAPIPRNRMDAKSKRTWKPMGSSGPTHGHAGLRELTAARVCVSGSPLSSSESLAES